MNLRAVEEAFLEDLYDERRRIRVELPAEGFVLYAVPPEDQRNLWKIWLASGFVAEAYAIGNLHVEDVDRLSRSVEITTVSRRRGSQATLVGGADEARALMIQHVADWIGDNFGMESRSTAEVLARDALALLRCRESLPLARAKAEQASRWFPAFHTAVGKEVARALESKDS